MFRRTCLVLSGLALALIGCDDKRAAGEQRGLDIDRSPVTEQPTARPEPPPPAQETGASDTPGASAVKPLMVKIESTQTAGDAIGTAQLFDDPQGVKVVIDLIKGPPGRHAVHVHEKADCGNKGENAGEHFAPDAKKHGIPGAGEHHMGDMGNIDVASDKSGKLEFLIHGANLKAGDPRSLIDRAIIVHEKEDQGTQPSGGAGGRIACGKITR